MRRVVHEGQTPRPLQLTSFCRPPHLPRLKNKAWSRPASGQWLFFSDATHKISRIRL